MCVLYWFQKGFRVLSLALGLLALSAYPALGDTCQCQSPCSGSISCPGGCYAFCEENPEGSGRHVCVKGCSTSDTNKQPVPTGIPGMGAVPAGPKLAAEMEECPRGSGKYCPVGTRCYCDSQGCTCVYKPPWN